ncbi:uncharacterized protein LOC113360110 [Papaver somniferum]|uniref:uncharacterized protein LOC113360110 n=1 Tax=Papaver somniferum TaxID=3469 RepID=UPI000E705AF1|nr:uncharacterized protein LOC113360110 [Papaver somniferum]
MSRLIESSSSSITSVPLHTLENIIPLKLQDDNFLTWKSLITPDEDTCVLLLLNASISVSVIVHVATCSTSKELWDNLHKRFGASSSAHTIQLSTQLQNMRLGSSKNSDDELLVTVLGGLGPDYHAFSTSIRIRSPPVTFGELHSLLLSEEIILSERNAALRYDAKSKAFLASTSQGQFRGFRPSYHFNFRGRGRGGISFRGGSHSSFTPTFRPSSSTDGSAPRTTASAARIICQICSKVGHTAIECFQRMNFAYQGRDPP